MFPDLATLPEGQHNSLLCPKCGGGKSQEKSLNVVVGKHGMKWICHRASCGWCGVEGDIHNATLYTNNGHTRAVDKDEPGYLRWPIRDNEFNCVGWEYRATEKWRKPKSMLNINEDWCGLHFPSPVRGGTVLIVEDRRSAERMNPYFPTVSLMGTHLSDDKITYLLAQGIKCGLLALDNDAITKAIKIKRQQPLICDIIYLQEDIKDMPLHSVITLAYKLQEKYYE